MRRSTMQPAMQSSTLRWKEPSFNTTKHSLKSTVANMSYLVNYIYDPLNPNGIEDIDPNEVRIPNIIL
jgi:hypothetical protein